MAFSSSNHDCCHDQGYTVSVSVEPFSQSSTHACDTCAHTHMHTYRDTHPSGSIGVYMRSTLQGTSVDSNTLFRTPNTSSVNIKTFTSATERCAGGGGGQTLHTALMGQKDKKRETTGDLFHRICHASPVENTNLFPKLAGCNNIQPSGSKSV